MNKGEAGTGEVPKGMNIGGAYEQSFGMLPEETTYSMGLQAKSMDLRPELLKTLNKGYGSIAAKAFGITAGGAGTAGYAMIPVYVDPRIHDESRKYTPLTEMLRRVTNRGTTADYNVITAKGAAFTAHPDAAMTEADDTYDRRSSQIKYLYSVGRVLGPAQAATPSYMVEGFEPTGAGNVPGSTFANGTAPNAMQLRVLTAARAYKELEEDLILNGDDSDDTTEFDGLITQQGSTNQNDLDGAALAYDDIEDSVQEAWDDGGRPDLAVAPSSIVTQIRKILKDEFRFSPSDYSNNEFTYGIPGAISLETISGRITVLPSQFMTNTSGSRQMFFFDSRFIEVRVLQDMTYEKLAKVNDSEKFMLKGYETVINRAPAFSSFLDNMA